MWVHWLRRSVTVALYGGAIALGVGALSGCIFPRVDLDSRPASPYAWYFRTRLGPSVLRGGTDTSGGRTACVERLGGDGSSNWLRAFEPFGEYSLRTFVAGLPAAAGSALVLAADDGAQGVAFLTIREDGTVERATELALDAPARSVRMMVPAGDGAIAVVPLPAASAAAARTLFVRVDAKGEVLWSTKVSNLYAVHTASFHQEHGVVVIGNGLDDGGASALLLATLGPDGGLRWMRPLEAPTLRPSVFGASAAFSANGDVFAAFPTSMPGTTDGTAQVTVARTDRSGSVRWGRQIGRPLPLQSGERPSPERRTGLMLQSVATDGEAMYVAATIPTSRNGTTRLVLVAIQPDGRVTSQRVVPATTEKPMSLSVEGGNVLVSSEDMASCLFPASVAADCGGPESPAGLPVVEASVRVGNPLGLAEPGPQRTVPIALRLRP